MQQRYYDPVIGRFYSNDPVGFTASNPMMFNRYAYANNNPYKYVDPDGRTGVPFALTPMDKGIGPTGQQDLTLEQQAQGAAVVAGAVVGGLALNVSKAAVTAVVSKVATQRNVSKIEDVTKPGSKLPNTKTDVTKKEFEQNLTDNGFASSTSKDGNTNIFTKGDTKYTTRDFSKSTDGPTAEVFVKDEPVSKIRLGENK